MAEVEETETTREREGWVSSSGKAEASSFYVRETTRGQCRTSKETQDRAEWAENEETQLTAADEDEDGLAGINIKEKANDSDDSDGGDVDIVP